MILLPGVFLSEVFFCDCNRGSASQEFLGTHTLSPIRSRVTQGVGQQNISLPSFYLCFCGKRTNGDTYWRVGWMWFGSGVV